MAKFIVMVVMNLIIDYTVVCCGALGRLSGTWIANSRLDWNTEPVIQAPILRSQFTTPAL